MSLRLILMRHAKSSWDDPLQEDHERPLNGRGRRSAKALGNWLRSKNITPDQMLVSSAERTKETCEHLSFDSEAIITDALYHPSPSAMMKELKRATGHTVLMLGHNPGIAWFARELVDTPPEHTRFADYPTCATLIVDFAIESWSDLRLGTGLVIDFITPRELRT